MDDEQMLRSRARKIAEDKIGFYMHLTAYVLVNALLIAIWWWSGGGFPWFLFVTVFWGIGLVSHGIGAFMGHGYTERMAEREYQKLKGQK
ncbi:MAG: 2TM domain-containing protein [Methanomassiliicoccus sp.]|nr:2TM domain-containing protein [Methanomassiliicoccus sp.]